MEHKVNYPRMLYKADSLQHESQGYLQDNARIGYKTVESESEEKSAKKDGWKNHPNTAKNDLSKRDRNRKIKSFLISNWKTWLGTSIALAGLYIAYLKLR